MVDNQLRDNDPPSTKKHTKNCLMQDILCGKRKEKIGVVVLTEIYDVMKKENQSYDEKEVYECIG